MSKTSTTNLIDNGCLSSPQAPPAISAPNVSAVTQIMFYVTNDFNSLIKNDKNKCYNDI